MTRPLVVKGDDEGQENARYKQDSDKHANKWGARKTDRNTTQQPTFFLLFPWPTKEGMRRARDDAKKNHLR